MSERIIMSKEAARIAGIARSNGVSSYMADVNLGSFNEFQSCVKKLSELNSGDKIFYVLFGIDNKNTLFFGVVAPNDVKFDRTTSTDFRKSWITIDDNTDNALYLLVEMQISLREIDKHTG